MRALAGWDTSQPFARASGPLSDHRRTTQHCRRPPALLECSSECHNVNPFNEVTLDICPGASSCRCNSRRLGSAPSAVTTLQTQSLSPTGAIGEVGTHPALLWSNDRIRVPDQEASHQEIEPAAATAKANSPRGQLTCDGSDRTGHHPTRRPRTSLITTYTAATVL